MVTCFKLGGVCGLLSRAQVRMRNRVTGLVLKRFLPTIALHNTTPKSLRTQVASTAMTTKQPPLRYFYKSLQAEDVGECKHPEPFSGGGKNLFVPLEDMSQTSLPKEDMSPNCFSALAEMLVGRVRDLPRDPWKGREDTHFHLLGVSATNTSRKTLPGRGLPNSAYCISANAEKQLGNISSFGKEGWDISSSGAK